MGVSEDKVKHCWTNLHSSNNLTDLQLGDSQFMCNAAHSSVTGKAAYVTKCCVIHLNDPSSCTSVAQGFMAR